MTRPGGNRPGSGAGNRPGLGGGNRPTTLPGGIGGNRPGLGSVNRPGGGGNRPGIGGGNRPGLGGGNPPWGQGNRPGLGGGNPGLGGGNPPWGQGNLRPTTLPGGIGGNRPGIGGGNRAGLVGGNRPGIGGVNPPWGQGNRGGLGGGNRLGLANRPVDPGFGNRPGLGNRPGGIGGIGNRPGIDNRPGGIGGIGNRPGIDNRPGGIGGIGNRPGIDNRPGDGILGGGDGLGNIGSGNIGSGNIIGSGNNYWGGGGGWFGSGGYYGGYGGWGGGYGGWGGGYYGPPAYGGGYYGDWYNGCWNHSGWGGFWAGLGVGALTNWGLNALYNPLYAYSYGMSSYFPTWSAYDYSSWGLESVATPWLYDGYSNPYNTPVTQTTIVQQPVPVPAGTEAVATPVATLAFDYSKPIGVMEPPPEPNDVDTAQEALTGARESFKAGDYARTLTLTDQALVQTPNDPILHEFRALVLFALKRYKEAAATAYAVLTAGPGWNWPTMVGLYPDVETYSNQLRELEANVRQNPNDAAGRFLLAYHYMVQGHKDAAANEFQNVVKLEPKDQLSARFAAALGATAPQPPKLPAQLTQAGDTGAAKPMDLAQAGVGDTSQARPEGESRAAEDVPLPPAPPQNLQGQWSAKPNQKTSIALALNPDGTFAWTVTQDGKSQTIQGWAGYQDQILTLAQETGPPLVGKVTVDPAGNRFAFKPPGMPKAVTGLSFEKAAAATAPASGT
jgi:tetratricopeptide (TPR) repeat protein